MQQFYLVTILIYFVLFVIEILIKNIRCKKLDIEFDYIEEIQKSIIKSFVPVIRLISLILIYNKLCYLSKFIRKGSDENKIK